MRILEEIGRADRPMSVTELARKLGHVPGTVFRSLDALEHSGYVARFRSSSRYVPGPSVNQLRQSLLTRFRLRDVSLPYLHQLAFASGETVSLTMAVGWYGVRLAAALGTNEVTNSPSVGVVRALDQTCAGRAILAFLPKDKLGKYRTWAHHAKGGDTQEKLFDEDLRATQDRGFAVEVASFAQDRASVAFAVHGNTGPIAGIAIEAPVLQLDRAGYHDNLDQWIDIVQSLQKVVSARPAAFAGPFAHIDPASIVLSPVE
jgi:DNA-binding IclR family transcriptional regulator